MKVTDRINAIIQIQKLVKMFDDADELELLVKMIEEAKLKLKELNENEKHEIMMNTIALAMPKQWSI